MRELREETGYQGVGERVIGEVFPNPAIMNNSERCVANDRRRAQLTGWVRRAGQCTQAQKRDGIHNALS